MSVLTDVSEPMPPSDSSSPDPGEQAQTQQLRSPLMRRVVVTGLGAVTPLGLDAQSTWDAAVAGSSGVDWIRSFDASEFPVRIASEVKGFEPEAIVGPKDARRLERNVVLAVAAAREAWADAGAEGVDPARAGILVGSAIGGV